MVSHGLLGQVRAERRPRRIARNPGGDPRAVGLPAGYPALHHALIVPITSLSFSYGWLCLVNKLGAQEFSDEDEKVVAVLGAQVGRIYENGSLYTEVQRHADQLQLEVLERKRVIEELRTSAKGGDDKVSATERAWQAKLAKREKELQALVDQSNKALREQMVDSVAMRMATEIAGDNAEIILPHITRRLSAEVVDGKAVTRVLDADAAGSALKPEELQKEFLSNDRFSAIVVASRASGSGAGGGRKGGGATSKRLSEMSATEEAKFANEKPAEYQQMLAAEQG